MIAVNRRRYMGGEDAPKEDKRIVAVFNVVDDSTTTRVLYSTSGVYAIEIDGVDQTVEALYQLSLGDHVVKIELTDNTKIPSQMFSACGRLTQATIPDTITSIGNNAFQNCKLLNTGGITIYAIVPPTLGSRIFRYVTGFYIYVPSESVDAYKAASGWSSYASTILAIPT